MGANSRPKSQLEPKMAAPVPAYAGTSVPARHAHDRLIFVMANFVGCQTVVTTKAGERFRGIFAASTLDTADSRLVLKMSKSLSAHDDQQVNGVDQRNDSYVGYGEDHVLTFEIKDIAFVEAQDVTTDKTQARTANGSSFRTDTDISGNQEVKERQLQAWQDSTNTTADMSLNGASAAGWDQFETNQKLFGLKSDYDETMYTTAINRSNPSYKQRLADAERIAEEIQSSDTNNSHIAEERNFISPDVDGMDEEARFSGVGRDVQALKANPNRYTPPARRAPTGQSTVTGAPVDPAIISSSLARPDSTKAPQGPKKPASALSGKENEKVSARAEAMADGTSNTNGTSKTQGKNGVQGAAEVDKDVLKPTELSANSSRGPAMANTKYSGTKNVQKDLIQSFKQFSASEKIKAIDKQREYQEKIRANKEKEREVKISDLKKFSTNFKLHSPVPHDILGIMARDKEKQKEIERRTQQSLEEQAVARRASIAPIEPDPSPSVNDRQNTKGPRGSQGPSNQMAGKPDKSANAHANGATSRIPGQLGQRLQQQYGGRGNMNGPQHAPAPDPRMQPALINTNAAPARTSDLPTPTSAISSFNVQAHEFRPNPAAMSFQPVDHKTSSTSLSRSRTKSNAKERPVNRVSFWSEGKKPEVQPKLCVNQKFNPFPRLRREAQQWIDGSSEEPKDVKIKEVEANGGIRHAYKTAPRWPVSEKMENKGWQQVLGDALFVSQPAPGFPMAHQHQLPAHLQGYYGTPRTPNQFRGQGHQQGRDYFEEHQRMQPSSSHSSVQPSPSMRNPMLANPQHGYRMDNGQLMYPVNGAPPMTPGRQYMPAQYPIPPGAPPMMMNHSQQGQYMGMQQQGQMPLYAQMPGQMYPMQAPPQGAYGSPRTAPMMLNQGSQHGHMPQQFIYQQQTGPGYPHHPQQQMPMRGSVPMMQQGSYGSGQQAHHQMSPYRGGPQFAVGNYAQQQQQQMMGGQMLQQQPSER